MDKKESGPEQPETLELPPNVNSARSTPVFFITTASTEVKSSLCG